MSGMDWDAAFSTQDYIFGTEPNAFLFAQRDILKSGQKALAIADGEGRNGVWLAGQGLDVLSIDLSAVGLAKAENLAASLGVTIRTEQVDLETWDWGESRFDVVVAIFIQFASPALRKQIFRRMKDVLMPGGLILLHGYGAGQLAYKTGGPSQIENLYTIPMLRDEFADMRILHLSAYDAVLNEGLRHRGQSALVDLVARKPGYESPEPRS